VLSSEVRPGARPRRLLSFRHTDHVQEAPDVPACAFLQSLNPEGRLVQTVDRTAAPAQLAKRLDTLEGKTVYLVDTGFGGSYKFMRELEGWFASHMPSVRR